MCSTMDDPREAIRNCVVHAFQQIFDYKKIMPDDIRRRRRHAWSLVVEGAQR